MYLLTLPPYSSIKRYSSRDLQSLMNDSRTITYSKVIINTDININLNNYYRN